MPRKSQWLQRLEQISALVEQSSITEFDREAISELFNLARAAAIDLMNKAGARRLGGALILDRTSLLCYLDSVKNGDVYQYEAKRVAKMTAALEESKEFFHAKRVEIKVDPTVFDIDLPGLPAGVEISRFKIEIGFINCEDALRKLFQLSQAIANDYLLFQKITDGA